MKEKINQFFVNNIKPKLAIVDQKINALIPNPKTKKILYVALGSLFGFMFLIIILGILFSPLKNKNVATDTITKKTSVINTAAPASALPLSETEQKLLDLETSIKSLRFPESILNVPMLEFDIKI